MANSAQEQRAVVQFVAAGAPDSIWNFVNGAAQDTIFRYSSGRPPHELTVQSFDRGLALRLNMEPRGADSTTISLSGRHYTGQSGRPGVFLAGREHWPEIMARGPAHDRLVAEGLRIQFGLESEREELNAIMRAAASKGADVRMVPDFGRQVSLDSLVRVLPGGRFGYCRAGHLKRDNHLDSLIIVDVVNLPDWCELNERDVSRLAGNTYVLADPRRTAVGDTLSVCAFLGWPGRAEAVMQTIEYYTDHRRCPYGAGMRQRSEPNMALLRRTR